MGKAKWWVCESCTSLNDLPANKCYNCRVPKPGDPKLIDDNYSQVGGGQKRVGITVDLAKIGDLTRPDPLETAAGGGIVEAFDQKDDSREGVDRESSTPATPRYDPYGGGYETGTTTETPTPPPIREPKRRGIVALGGRHWTEEPAAEPVDVERDSDRTSPPVPPPPAGTAPSPPGAVPPPPAGTAPPPPGAVPPGALPPPLGFAPPPPGVAPPPSSAVPPPGAQRPPGAQPRPMPPPPPGAQRPPGAPPTPPSPGVQGRPPMTPPPPRTPPPPPAPPREAPKDD
jgi:formin 2